jgi:hypothetical protein
MFLIFRSSVNFEIDQENYFQLAESDNQRVINKRKKVIDNLLAG